MNKFYTLIVSALFLFSMQSCKSTSNNNIVDNTANNYVKATIGSTSFLANGMYVSVYDTIGQIGVSGVLTSGAFISLDVYNYAGKIGKVGVVSVLNPLNFSPNSLIAYKNAAGATQYALYGYVNITNISSGMVQGTFACTFPDSTKINDGSFYAFW
jgi:hypothetical protein